MGTFERRLSRVQSAMDPRQQATAHVLGLLERFDSKEECLVWEFEHLGETSLQRLCYQLGESVCKAHKGLWRSWYEAEAALLDALGDFSWQVELFEQLNEATEERVKDTMPRYVFLVSRLEQMLRAAFGDMILLNWRPLAEVVPGRFPPRIAPLTLTEDVSSDYERQHARWAQEARTQIKIRYAVGMAHEQIAATDFGGHPVLWKHTAEALANRTREAEALLTAHITAFALPRESLKKKMPFNPERLIEDKHVIAYVSEVSKEILDQIKQEAGALASEYVSSLKEAVRARLLLERGDSSEVLRLLKQSKETAKPRDPKAGNPDPGGCVRRAQDQAGHAAGSQD